MASLVLADYIGFVGTALLLLAFTRAAFQGEYLGSSNFLVLNLVGSCFLLVPDYVHDSYQAFTIGCFWASISLSSLLNRNHLSDLALKVHTCLFALPVIALLYHDITAFNQFELSRSGFAWNIMATFGIVSAVAIYAMVASKRIARLQYLSMTLINKALFVPCLVFDENYPSLMLQSYGALVSISGLVGVWLAERKRIDWRQSDA